MKVTYRNIVKGRSKITAFCEAQKALGSFRVIDVGGCVNGWSRNIADTIVDIQASRPQDYKVNISNEDEWREILQDVEKNGKYDYCICTHTIEDISNPQLVLRMLPRIAKAGIITMPSVAAELSRLETHEWLGFIHHRHIFDVQDDVVVVAPKLNFLESLVGQGYKPERSADNPIGEIAIEWSDNIPFRMIMDDYLGPGIEHVIKDYTKFIDQAHKNIFK